MPAKLIVVRPARMLDVGHPVTLSALRNLLAALDIPGLMTLISDTQVVPNQVGIPDVAGQQPLHPVGGWIRPPAPPVANRSCALPAKSVSSDTPEPAAWVPNGKSAPQCTHELPQCPSPTVPLPTPRPWPLPPPHPLPEVAPFYQELTATVVLVPFPISSSYR